MSKKKSNKKKRRSYSNNRTRRVTSTPKRTVTRTTTKKTPVAPPPKKKTLKLRKSIIALVLIGIVVLLLLVLLPKDKISINKNDLIISLNGKDSITLEYGDTYKDEGAIAKYKDKDLTKDINIDTDIDLKKLGKYYYKYSISYEDISKEVKREIIIKDTKKPSITLKGNSTETIYLGSTYNDKGVTSKDNYDGDLTKSITTTGTVNTNKVGTYTLIYKVKDSSGNENSIKRTVKVIKKDNSSNNTNTTDGVVGKTSKGYTIEKKNGLYYVNGILIANKTYSLPSTYNPGGLQKVFNTNFDKMKEAAKKEGLNIYVISGFRSYSYQNTIYNKYVKADGKEEADRYSARPGHSEHQTGLAADINKIDYDWGSTPEGKWVNDNCYKYGFIIRYLEGKEDVTGYKYEPWHIRYVGVDIATKLYNNGNWIALEDYLGITSEYDY